MTGLILPPRGIIRPPLAAMPLRYDSFMGRAGQAVPGDPPPPFDGLSGLTGAWSMSRPLLTAWTDPFYTEVSGAVSVLADQSGATRNFGQATSGARPLVATAGPLNRDCASFDGTDDVMNTTATIADFINNTSGYIIASAIVDAITTNIAATYTNDCIWSDSGSFLGFHLKSVPTGHAFNWDGSDDRTTHSAFPVGSAVVVEWWHTSAGSSGTLSSRVNGGTVETAASGNTSTITNTLRIGRTGVSGSAFTDYKLFEIACFDAIPAEATRDAIMANFKAWIGAI